MAALDAYLGSSLEPRRLRAGLAAVRHPGRFEVLAGQPTVVLDGAHNADGARAATSTRHEFHPGPFTLVVGMNRGRDLREMFQALEAAKATRVITCAADWPKSIPAHALAAAAAEAGAKAEAAASVATAVDRAGDAARPDELVLVVGSLYVIGEARTALGLHP